VKSAERKAASFFKTEPAGGGTDAATHHTDRRCCSASGAIHKANCAQQRRKRTRRLQSGGSYFRPEATQNVNTTPCMECALARSSVRWYAWKVRIEWRERGRPGESSCPTSCILDPSQCSSLASASLREDSHFLLCPIALYPLTGSCPSHFRGIARSASQQRFGLWHVADGRVAGYLARLTAHRIMASDRSWRPSLRKNTSRRHTLGRPLLLLPPWSASFLSFPFEQPGATLACAYVVCAVQGYCSSCDELACRPCDTPRPPEALHNQPQLLLARSRRTEGVSSILRISAVLQHHRDTIHALLPPSAAAPACSCGTHAGGATTQRAA